VSAGLLMLVLSQYKTPLALMIPMFIAAFGFALTLGSAAGRALSLFPKQAGTASALLGAMQMSGASLLVFITQYLNLSTPELIGTHFLLLIPFSYLLFRYTKYA